MTLHSTAAIALLALPALAQSPAVLHSGEAIFTISVRGGNDALHTDGRLEVLDDGKNGEIRVALSVNGQPIGSAHASEPFGVARTTVKIP